MINVFFPYYQCGDKDRQREIDLCLRKNADNKLIDKLFVVIDDGCDCPVSEENVDIIRISKRLTYKLWVELTQQFCQAGVTILCNSDIYFNETLSVINDVLCSSNRFVALSRWELLGNNLSKHPNPHWSQDTWAMRVGENLSSSFMDQLDFPMGVPRCDNKVAYLFATRGWKIFNPVNFLVSVHAHETQMRTYHKKLDDRILGGVAYVYPGSTVSEESTLDFDVWTKRTSKINKIAINKTMEKWIKEAEQESLKNETELTVVPDILFQTASSVELLSAFSSSDVLYSAGPNFDVRTNDSNVIFKNAYNFQKPLKLKKSKYDKYSSFSNVAGLIPPVLQTYVEQIGIKASSADDLNFWQYPCATEKQAYENHLAIRHGEHLDVSAKEVNIYIPLPWATYVDKKGFPERYLERIKTLIAMYKQLAESHGFALKAHTVCQHIHWARMLEKAEWLGVTDFHISHKSSCSEGVQQEVGTTLTLHGWPLIAVNYVTPERSEGMERKPVIERKLLASFIGAHMPHYRDDSRIKLFEAAKKCGRDDVLVDLGNEWHFNKVVYEEQVLNKEVDAHHIDEHNKKTFRYNTILSDSKFSLCPEGAGPNTLRFWESIAVGSVPVIFSKDLAVLEENRALLDNVIIWEENIGAELFSLLESIDERTLSKMSAAVIESYNNISTNFRCF